MVKAPIRAMNGMVWKQAPSRLRWPGWAFPRPVAWSLVLAVGFGHGVQVRFRHGFGSGAAVPVLLHPVVGVGMVAGQVAGGAGDRQQAGHAKPCDMFAALIIP